MKIDVEKVTDHLVRFIKDTVTGAEKDGVVLGLSGGVDSAVVAMLAVKALGPEGVTLLWMPAGTSRLLGHDSAAGVARICGVYLTDCPVHAPSIVMSCDSAANKIRLGNWAARLRMIALYNKAALLDRLVIGTSNKSEIMLGYGTLHGDTACDLNPIGGLYKTQVYQLAEYLGVPQRIIEKPPSADLWPGQTDEGELGFSYEEADPILRAIDQGVQTGDAHVPDLVKQVTEVYRRNAFKRRGPLVAEVP